MAVPNRQMSLVAFMQAGNATVYAGSWRHPATEHGFLSAAYYEKLGRILEQGCFDMMFFDDRLAMPGIYGGSVAEAVRHGARPVKLDLSIVLGVIAGATQHIGLGATYSTTYYDPFHVARTFATLDHLSAGRAAWNVVTSVNDSEARNFGFEQALGHDERYDRADEFMRAVTALWDSWDDDALILDRVNGVFADPDKVHELGFEGEWFKTQGPLTVPRSPQGRPVILQAGSSGRGRDFAGRWAEVIFTGDPGIDVARAHYKDQKEKIAELGRDPQTVKILPMAYTVVGESSAHAQEREQAFLNDFVDPMASLTLLSELMNHDFSGIPLDAPITDELIESVSGIRGLVQNLRKHIGDDITLADLAGHRATLLQGPRFVGTGSEVADQMEEWFNSEACDGFVIAATHSPGAYEDVVRMVIPELQRRGVFRDRYTGATLRENLGLDRPQSVFAGARASVEGAAG
jgi:FMN-dependent oxidoreductase (nitrilotriacetate monooxygenase family)